MLQPSPMTALLSMDGSAKVIRALPQFKLK
jgi:hypothetical protein